MKTVNTLVKSDIEDLFEHYKAKDFIKNPPEVVLIKGVEFVKILPLRYYGNYYNGLYASKEKRCFNGLPLLLDIIIKETTKKFMWDKEKNFGTRIY